MRKILLTLLLCFIGYTSLAGIAFAADKKARKMVAEMAETRDRLLEKHPAITLIDDAVRKDCVAKGTGAKSDGEYCSCASAVVFGLWMSGIDPKMVGRLNEFLQQPSEQAASAFTNYQGPELYSPLCSMAL